MKRVKQNKETKVFSVGQMGIWTERNSPFYFLNFSLYNLNKLFFLAMLTHFWRPLYRNMVHYGAHRYQLQHFYYLHDDWLQMLSVYFHVLDVWLKL